MSWTLQMFSDHCLREDGLARDHPFSTPVPIPPCVHMQKIVS
jgi:hypothetical protein